MQKARRRPKASTACKHMVSGSISLPCLGYFSPFPHGTGSLSVSREYLALDDGPPRFRQGFTCPALLRIPDWLNHYMYRIITLFDVSFQTTSISDLHHYSGPTTPIMPKHNWFGLVPLRSPLLRESLFDFYSSGYWDVSVLRVGLPITRDIRVAPFGNLRIKYLFAVIRSLSQLVTSFIASESLGIHHMLFFFFFDIFVY